MARRRPPALRQDRDGHRRGRDLGRACSARGAQGAAGDIGHVYVCARRRGRLGCGNLGCLEALASGSAIARAPHAAGIPAENSRDVVDLVKNGNVDASRAVRQAGRDIGEVLTTCVSLMNPSVIVLGGAMAEGAST